MKQHFLLLLWKLVGWNERTFSKKSFSLKYRMKSNCQLATYQAVSILVLSVNYLKSLLKTHLMSQFFKDDVYL